MSRRIASFLPLIALTFALPGPGRADSDPLPAPRRTFDEESDGFSPAEFERMLSKLRAEREGLNADWQALRKRNTAPEPNLEAEQRHLQKQIQKALEGLRKGRANLGPTDPFAPVVRVSPEIEPAAKKVEKKSVAGPVAAPEKTVSAVDALAQGHSLLRSQQYEEALAALQQVDLRGKKANERAPIQYLKACCLLHLDKTADAIELLQEVANYRGDEKLAGYAQWHLEMIRWQRDVAQRLREVRDRYKALEKSP